MVYNLAALSHVIMNKEYRVGEGCIFKLHAKCQRFPISSNQIMRLFWKITMLHLNITKKESLQGEFPILCESLCIWNQSDHKNFSFSILARTS